MFPKKNTPLFFFILLFFTTTVCSQDAITLSFHQDFKLMAFGDNLGNRAGTLDLLTRIKYETKQKSKGFYVFAIEFERADISMGYSRYGGVFGYTFSNVFNDTDFQLTPSLGLGNISRHGEDSISWSGSIQLAYRLSNRMRISFLNQFTERTDLELMYGKKETRYSFFLGFQLKLFRFNKSK